VIERAADAGINYFDTARVYQGGNNERMVGAALKKYRDKVFISSKTQAKDQQVGPGGPGNQPEGVADRSPGRLAPSQPEHAGHGQRRSARGAADRQAGREDPVRRRELPRRARGDDPGHAQAESLRRLPDELQLHHGPAIEPLLVAARKANVGLVAMKALAGGVKPTVRSYKVDPDKLQQADSRRSAAGGPEVGAEEPHIDTVIPSIVDNEQLDENISAMGAPFSAADGKLLARRLEEIKPLYCRMCGHCEGQCAQGLPVADVLRFLMYAEGYGQFALGREHFKALPAELAAVRCARAATAPSSAPTECRWPPACIKRTEPRP
jgi:predicted aldo/keto reductase-like oxidoreductase